MPTPTPDLCGRNESFDEKESLGKTACFRVSVAKISVAAEPSRYVADALIDYRRKAVKK